MEDINLAEREKKPPVKIQMAETIGQKLDRLVHDRTVKKITIFKSGDNRIMKIVGSR